MAVLIVRLPGGTTRRVAVSQRPLTLGRSASCDVHLPSDEISREHAEVWLDEAGHVLVADKRSKNGTRVDHGDTFRNGVRTATKSIRIGEFEIEVVGGQAPAEADTEVRFQHDTPVRHADESYFQSGRLALELNQRRLELLMGLGDRIGGVFDRKELLSQALDACCEALDFERGLIALKTPRGETEAPVTRNVQRDDTGAYTVSRTLINKALVQGECAIVNDLALDLAGQMSESLVRYPIRSALCVPILHRSEILGVIYGDRITTASRYTPADVAFLAAIAQQVGLGITNLRLFARHVDLQKVLEELRQARGIQESLFPAAPLHAGNFTLAGYNEPSSHVGGDYYDFFEVGAGRIGLTVADVTGHGLPAAMLMANFQAAIHVSLPAQMPLAELAVRLNQHVCRSTASNVFITAIFGWLDVATGTLEFVNAGHPAPILLGRGGVRSLDEGISLPLGVEADEQFRVQHLETEPDLDAALFYTDGLVEAENAAGQMLQVGPVAEALGAVADRTPESVLKAALAVVNRHLAGAKNADDLTLLALHRGRG
jgi:phosphoserine phosphatase RsbU/P